MKTVYIAHPIKGSKANIGKVIDIIRKINLEEPDVHPFAPYLCDLMALQDDKLEERERGMQNNYHIFKSGIIDELRLYGDRISTGMLREVVWAWELDISVRPMTCNLHDKYIDIFLGYTKQDK